jgi:hypothetical protein
MRHTRRYLLAAGFAALAAPAAAQPHGSSSSSSSQEQAPATRQERLTSAESWVPMPTLSAGVLQRYSSSGTLVIDCGLDIPDEALRRRANLNAPRLRDALRTALSTYATTFYRDRTAPEPVVLTRLMQQAVDRTLGSAGARVMMVNIIYQRRQA